MTAPASADPNRWSDLRPRLISAAVMIAVGAGEIWLGGFSFMLLVVLLIAAMVWELAKITANTADNMPLWLAGAAAVSLAICFYSPREFGTTLLLAPALMFALTQRRERRLGSAWAAAVMIAGYGLVVLRDEAGSPAILWVVLVVVASDVMGYFAGRILGGPKFWPKVSPKKTWSGTIAGWLGAVAVGAGFMAYGYSDWGILILSPLVALAGQMGDIGESWLKRRTGVKDSSNLIPGHGGVLDRFDALTGAVVALMLLDLIVSIPLPVTLGL